MAWQVDIDPSCPVFIACTSASTSSPRTSPTMIRSGRSRSAVRTSRASVDRRSGRRRAPAAPRDGRVRAVDGSSAVSSITSNRSPARDIGDERGDAATSCPTTWRRDTRTLHRARDDLVGAASAAVAGSVKSSSRPHVGGGTGGSTARRRRRRPAGAPHRPATPSASGHRRSARFGRRAGRSARGSVRSDDRLAGRGGARHGDSVPARSTQTSMAALTRTSSMSGSREDSSSSPSPFSRAIARAARRRWSSRSRAVRAAPDLGVDDLGGRRRRTVADDRHTSRTTRSSRRPS